MKKIKTIVKEEIINFINETSESSIVGAEEIKAGDYFEKNEGGHFGITRFAAMGSLKQSKTHKNEYYIPATVISTTGDFYEEMQEVHVPFKIRYGQVGKVKYIGKHGSSIYR